MAAVEELLIQLSRVLHSCMGQASTKTVGPYMSQYGKWLLIYGGEKAKLVVASKTALLLFSSNVKTQYVFKEMVLALFRNFHYFF